MTTMRACFCSTASRTMWKNSPGDSSLGSTGCTITVPANGMATIAAKSPCAGGPGLVQAGGSSAQLRMPKWGPGAYFAGAGAVVIGGAVIYGLTDPTSDDPVTP